MSTQNAAAIAGPGQSTAALGPLVSVYLRETTGSFVAAFLLIPVILLVMAGIIWFYSPEHARKKLDAISV
jgi:cyanate permease